MTPNDRIGPNAALLFLGKKEKLMWGYVIDNSHSIDNTQTPLADTLDSQVLQMVRCPISLAIKTKFHIVGIRHSLVVKFD